MSSLNIVAIRTAGAHGVDRERLTRLGYQTTEVTGTGPALKAAVAERRPDVLLFDMEAAGNAEALTEARSLQRLFNLPAILVMPPGAHDRGSVDIPGTFALLTFPFSDAELKAAIELLHCQHAAATNMARLNRIIDAFMQIGQVAIRSASRDELFQSVTRLLVEIGGFDLAWVGWLNPGETRILPVAHFGRAGELLDEAAFDMTDLPTGQGTPSNAIREGRPKVCNACPQDTCHYPPLQAPRRYGFQSCGSFPVWLRGEARGVLSVCAFAPDFFRGRECDLLNEVAAILSSALDKMAAEEELKRVAHFREAAQESEARFRILFQQIKDGLLVVDAASWQILLSNPPMCRMLGRSEEELSRLSVRDIHPPDAMGRVAEQFLRLAAGDLDVAPDIPVLRKDGSVLLADISASRCQLDGRPCAVGLFRDTTERRESDRKARSQETQLRMVLNAAGMVSWECDLVSGAIHYSDNLASLLDRSDVTPFLSLHSLAPEIHPDDQGRLQQAIQRVVREGGRFECDYRVRHPDGGWRWFLGMGDSAVSPEGKPSKLIGVSLDITERKRIEQALRAREEIFSSIVEQAMASIVLIDGGTGRFVEFNRSAYEGLGYTREEFSHMGIANIQAEHSPEQIRNNLAIIRERGGLAFESKHRNRNGEDRDVRVSVRALRVQGKDFMAAVWDDITEQKRATLALQAEQRRLAAIITGADVGTWEWNIQTGETVFNERWAAITGHTLADLAPVSIQTWIQLVHPEDLKLSGDLLQRHFAGDLQYYDCEARMRHKDGRWVWVLDRGKVTSWTPDGKPLWMQGVHTDITERKRREAYRGMSHEALLILSEPGELPAALHRILQLIKTTTEVEAVGMRLQEGEDFPYISQIGFSPEFIRSENSLLKRQGKGEPCLDLCGRVGLECTCGLVISGKVDPSKPSFTPGGSAYSNDPEIVMNLAAADDLRLNPRNTCLHQGYASIALIPLRARGRIIGLLHLCDRSRNRFTLEAVEMLEDIARNLGEALLRKHAEMALFESEERLKHLVAAAQDAIIMVDPGGRVSLWNQAAIRMLGYTEQEAIGQDLHHFIAPERFHTAFTEAFVDFQRTGRGSAVGQVRELAAQRKDGSEFPIELSLAPVQLAGGWHAVGIMRDITERKRMQGERESMEAQLRQQQKLESLGTLAGGVAHEINNPINGVMNYAQLIQDRLPADSPLAEFTGEILHETQRVATIVRNLLTFARNEKQSHSPARMVDIVEGTLSLIRTVIRHDHITLNIRIPSDLPELKCRSQQIQQVLMNLMTNARDALNERHPGQAAGKDMDVSAHLFEKEGRRWIRVTVEDHGTGISPEVRARMFDPFFTTKRRDQGTGLGLSISHGIVTDHHGQLTVETEPGRFTRVHMDLPVDNGWEL